MVKKNLKFFLGLGTLVATLGFLFFLSKKATKVTLYPYAYAVTAETEGQTNLQLQISFYEKRLARDPKSFSNLSAVANLYSALAKLTGYDEYFGKAETYAQRSLQEMPYYNLEALYVMANAAQAKHEFTEAIKYGEKLLKQKPGTPEGHLILANSYLALGELTQGEASVTKLIQSDPSENSYTVQALIFAQEGRDEEARRAFSTALKNEIDDATQASWTRVMFGRFLTSRGSFEEGQGLIEEALRILPNSGLALQQLAESHLHQGDFPKAKKFFQSAFAASRRSISLYGEARTLLYLGKRESALELMAQIEKLLRADLSEKKNGHQNELIQLLLERNFPKDRPEALQLALQETERRSNAETLLLLARAQLASSHFFQANAVMKEIFSRKMVSPEILMVAIKIDKKLDDRLSAQSHLKRLQQMYPKFEDDPLLASMETAENRSPFQWVQAQVN